MESVKPTRAKRIPAQRHDLYDGSLTQARVDALFRALAARREYEEGVARLSETEPPAQRESAD